MDNSFPSETSEIRELINKYSPIFLEIRKRIFFTLGAFLVSTIVGFVYYEKIIRLLIELLSLKGVNIVFTSPFQFINLAISCGVAAGLLITFPLIVIQILSFLKPALKRKEFKMITRLLPFSIILFLVGFSFGILVMKWQIQLFLAESVALGIGNILDISRLMGIVLLVSSIMGIFFQFPIVIIALVRLGIVSHEQIAKSRFWVYLSSLILIFFLPIDSIMADVLLTLPIIFLFEVTLFLNRFSGKRKASARLKNLSL